MVVVGFIKTGERLPGAILASVPGAPGTLVMAPLNTAAPNGVSTSPSTFTPATVNATPLNPKSVFASALAPSTGQPPAQLVSNRQPAAPLNQQNREPVHGDQPGTDAGVPAGAAGTISNSALPAPNSAQIISPAPNNAFTVQGPSSNQSATSSSSGRSGDSSSNAGKPLQSALNSVRNAIDSVADNVTRSISTKPSGEDKPGVERFCGIGIALTAERDAAD